MNYKIKVGDVVKVIDLYNPRDEIVEGIGDVAGKPAYMLSDGTWVTSTHITPYKVQGSVRRVLIDKLRETVNHADRT